MCGICGVVYSHPERPVEREMLRQMTEIRAVVPALHDDFSSEPIFARSRIGAPLEWSGALPPARLSERLERAGGPGAGGLRSVLEHGARSW